MMSTFMSILVSIFILMSIMNQIQGAQDAHRAQVKVLMQSLMIPPRCSRCSCVRESMRLPSLMKVRLPCLWAA